MKTLIYWTAFLLLSPSGFAQGRYFTLKFPTATTNTLSVSSNEIVEIVAAFHPSVFTFALWADGNRYRFYGGDINQGGEPMKFVGPALLEVITSSGEAFCTVRITPESFPPDKTIVIPQGGGANIALECSTNLIDWTPATLGVYTNQPSNKFFRLKAERVP